MDNLKFMKVQLIDVLHLPYAFNEWKDDDFPETYWIGELQEVPTILENGYEESIFILTGTTRGNWLDIMQTKNSLKEHFSPIYGLRGNTESGSIVIFYESSISVPTGEADLKRLQINFRIKEYKKG